MTAPPTFDDFAVRVSAGDRLSAEEVATLAASPDVLSVGMLADTARRRLHGTRVTYLRVATCGFNRSFAEAVPPAAREIRITGSPEKVAQALAAVQSAKAVAGDRAVSGFSWNDIERLAAGANIPVARACADLRAAGLDAFAEISLDTLTDGGTVVETLRQAGFEQLRLTIQDAPAVERTALFLQAARMQEQFGGIQAINPLPMAVHASRPTTGYEDVKAVAVARLAAPSIPTIQVDWHRYGPKLAQVALTFGADDLDAVTAGDDAPEGRRRAPLEEVRRNIDAAGFSAAERDGRFRTIDRLTSHS